MMMMNDDEEGASISDRFRLMLAGIGNGGFLLVFDLAGTTTRGFDGFDNSKRLFICDFAEDDVFAVEPAGDDGGDEELGAVAGMNLSTCDLVDSLPVMVVGDLRVGACVGH